MFLLCINDANLSIVDTESDIPSLRSLKFTYLIKSL